MFLQPPPPGARENRGVIFFDVDNTLYSKHDGVGELMQAYIRKYFEEKLHLTPKEAERTHIAYYKKYGLALEGLVVLNHVDTMDYNARVDDALPLEKCLHKNPELKKMLASIDRTKWQLWLCTNAYVTHGLKVVKLLEIEEFFEGITFCDYKSLPLVCKPNHEFFNHCMEEVGKKPEQCYFVDDNHANASAARELGWNAIHFNESDIGCYESREIEMPQDSGSPAVISNILDLRQVWPEVFYHHIDEKGASTTTTDVKLSWPQPSVVRSAHEITVDATAQKKPVRTQVRNVPAVHGIPTR